MKVSVCCLEWCQVKSGTGKNGPFSILRLGVGVWNRGFKLRDWGLSLGVWSGSLFFIVNSESYMKY